MMAEPVKWTAESMVETVSELDVITNMILESVPIKVIATSDGTATTEEERLLRELLDAMSNLRKAAERYAAVSSGLGKIVGG